MKPHRMHRRRLLALGAEVVLTLGLALPLAACDKSAPPEATKRLESAMAALGKGDAKAFTDTLPPSQRSKAESRPEWKHFMAVKKAKLGDPLQVEDSQLKITTMLYFDEKAEVFNTVTFVLSKEDGDWWVDLDETIALQKRVNGTDAFATWTFEK